MVKPREDSVQVLIKNINGTLRWDITIEEEQGDFFIVMETDISHSLFINPLSHGHSVGEALNNFLNIEEDLLNSL